MLSNLLVTQFAANHLQTSSRRKHFFPFACDKSDTAASFTNEAVVLRFYDDVELNTRLQL